jgi:hypothetical protein
MGRRAARSETARAMKIVAVALFGMPVLAGKGRGLFFL